MTLSTMTIETVEIKERSIGRQLARELNQDELDTISGGVRLSPADYTPTGNPESDCD